jgi:hypothetical protein
MNSVGCWKEGYRGFICFAELSYSSDSTLFVVLPVFVVQLAGERESTESWDWHRLPDELH